MPVLLLYPTYTSAQFLPRENYLMPVFGLQPASLLQTIFEDIGVALAIIDKDDRVVFANRTALDFFGTPEGEGIITFQEWRKNFRFEDAIGKEIPIEESAVMRAMLGEHLQSEEVKVKMPDGSLKWVMTWAYQFCSMGMRGVIAVFVDQTSEMELRKAAAQMQRMETLGLLAAGLTHDFNNILNTISTNIALVSDNEQMPHSVRLRLEQVSEAVERAAGLVTRLMQFSRTHALHKRQLQVNDIVREVVRLVSPLLRKDISLNLDLGRDLAPIDADPPQLEQVLINLIINALDAMPHGGELKISTSAIRHLDGRSEPDGDSEEDWQKFISIAVADSGVGIPEELQYAIFEPFFTTKPEGKGTGLGLSSSYGIIRQHNASIEVESKPGQGSTFTIVFPAERVVAHNV
jgi:two-component system cell cycle sensor histidine kinase/response regulator CckA